MFLTGRVRSTALRKVARGTQTSPCVNTRRCISTSQALRPEQTANDIAKKQQELDDQINSSPYPQGNSKNRSRNIALAVLALATIAYGNYFLYSNPPPPFTGFDKQKFTKCTIISKVPVSSTAFIYTVRPSGSSLTPSELAKVYREYWEKGLWSLEFKQPALQIARSYTPLPPRDENDDELRFLIRRMQGGEMSNYLSRLGEGDSVQVRGPDLEFEVTAEKRGEDVEIVFLAGGTGVACALQAAHTFLGGGENRKGKLRLLWANRRREDCVDAPVARSAGGWAFWKSSPQVVGEDGEANEIVGEINRLKNLYRDKFEIEYFVDEENMFITPEVVSKVLKEAEGDAGEKRRLLMVSGPNGFIEYFAGKKGDWVGSKQEQGPVGGVSRALGLRKWEVVKL